jgi:hypothetical protein
MTTNGERRRPVHGLSTETHRTAICPHIRKRTMVIMDLGQLRNRLWFLPDRYEGPVAIFHDEEDQAEWQANPERFQGLSECASDRFLPASTRSTST